MTLNPAIERSLIRKALLSRRADEKLLELFSQGKLFGTVHTCIGQEFSGATVCSLLQTGDAVFSNHRCHGHFLSYCEDIDGLIAELMGKSTGVCGGKGGSQHLCKDGFYSNGIQGGIVPVAAGLAFARKLDKKSKIATVFIGDGTLGEGVLYETMNLASKWNLPLLIVLEDNGYAQSTNQTETLAGEIGARAKSFSMAFETADTWNWRELYKKADALMNYVRDESRPALLRVETFRLKAHSKGDDNRPRELIEKYEDRDPINLLIKESHPAVISQISEVELLVESATKKAALQPDPELSVRALSLNACKNQIIQWAPHQPSSKKVGVAINESFKSLMERFPTDFYW